MKSTKQIVQEMERAELEEILEYAAIDFYPSQSDGALKRDVYSAFEQKLITADEIETAANTRKNESWTAAGNRVFNAFERGLKAHLTKKAVIK